MFSNIRESLIRAANDVVVNGIYVAIDSQNLPQSIKNNISISPVQEGDGNLYIDIVIDVSDDGGAPEAKAFEYGSGLHRTKGLPKKYIIEPKNASALKFPFTITYMPGMKFKGVKGMRYKEVVQQLADIGEVSGEMFWNYVEHPGIRPRPFIKPALESMKSRILQLMAKAVKFDVLVTWKGIDDATK